MADSAANISGDSGARRADLVFMAASFAIWGAASTFLGAVSPEIQTAFGLSDAGFGAVVAAAAAGGIGGAFIGGGLLADRDPIAPIRAAAFIGACLMAIAVFAPTGALFGLASFLLVISMTTVSTLAHGAVARLPRPGDAARWLARVETGFSLGAAAGPTVVIVALAFWDDWRSPFLLAAGILLATLSAVSLVAPTPRPGPIEPGEERPSMARTLRAAMRAPAIAPILLVGVCGAWIELAHGAWTVLHGVRAVGVSADDARISLTILMAATLLARMSIPTAVRVFGARRLLLASSAISACAFVMLTQAASVWTLWAANAAIGVAAGFHFPVTLLIAMERWPKLGASLSGLLIIGESIGFLTAALLIGAVAELVGFARAYWLLAGAAVVWCWALMWYFRRVDAAAAEAAPAV